MQLVGMVNEVRIFEASLFNSELDSNFTNSKLDTRNLSHSDIQGDSVSFTARSYGVSWCSAATGRRPIGDIVSSLLSRRYVDCAPDYSVELLHEAATLVLTSMRESTSNSFTRIQQLYCNHCLA